MRTHAPQKRSCGAMQWHNPRDVGVVVGEDDDVWGIDVSPDTQSYSPSSAGSLSSFVSARGAAARPVEAVVISDAEGDGDDDGDDLHIQRVYRPTAEEIRRQRMDAARAALRRAANAAPRRPPPTNPLLSTYKCSVCLCAPTNVCVTPCGHIFCGACLYDALAMQLRQDGNAWSETDWLGVMGDPLAGRQTRTNSSIFTPFGSGGAMALANAAGVSSTPTRELFSELVSQRQARAPDEPPAETSSLPASRLRATNGTGKLRGHCPVCRTMIPGGFTGPSRRGILGLDIMVGTPAPEPQPVDEKDKHTNEPGTSDAPPSHTKRVRVQ